MMGLFQAMDLSASGLSAQRLRMNVLSNNLANVHSTRTPEGGVYQRQDVVFSAVPSSRNFHDFLDDTHLTQLRKVKVTNIHQDETAPRQVFDPTHPDANARGYVEMPNINVMTEMVNMIMATRAYEGNATAIENSKQMAIKAIELGRA